MKIGFVPIDGTCRVDIDDRYDGNEATWVAVDAKK